MSAQVQPLGDGAVNLALANELSKLIADFTGRGASRSRAFINGDLVVLLLKDGATRGERNLIAAGKDEVVRLHHDALRRALAPQLIEAVERITGRRVGEFVSGTSANSEYSVEAFIIDPEPAPGG